MKQFKKLEKAMDAYELESFLNSSFKYDHINGDDARVLSKSNIPQNIRFGSVNEDGLMPFISHKNGLHQGEEGLISASFKGNVWVKYSEAYKRSLEDLQVVIDQTTADGIVTEDLVNLMHYLSGQYTKGEDNE